ncbi:MAG: YqaA family protein [bacterium]
MIKKIYDWVLTLADKSYSQAALFGLAFIEPFIFPVPPDVLLMPMCLGARLKSLRFAVICTIGSLAGAGIGYSIGHFLWWSGDGQFSAIACWFFNHVPGFSDTQFFKIQNLYERYNFWIVFAAAFTPIPFKVITITAGAFKINFMMFLVASTIGRAGRFFLVAGLFRIFGKPVKAFIDKYFNILSIIFMILIISGVFTLKFLLG